MVRATAEIINVLNSVIFMIISFIMLHDKQYGKNTDLIFFVVNVAKIAYYYFTLAYFKSKSFKSDVVADLSQTVFMICFLTFLTPLLQSLTVKISDDTIVSLIAILIFFHCLFFEYQIQKNKNESIVNHPISFNSIFFATILLGSRLSRNTSGFVLLL